MYPQTHFPWDCIMTSLAPQRILKWVGWQIEDFSAAKFADTSRTARERLRLPASVSITYQWHLYLLILYSYLSSLCNFLYFTVRKDYFNYKSYNGNSSTTQLLRLVSFHL